MDPDATPAPAARSASDPAAAGAQAPAPTVVPLLEERVEIETVREQTGLVRVRKIVHEAPQTFDAPASREQVQTVRVPVGRVVERAEGVQQRGAVLVVPVYEERWVRQLVLVEEIHVTKLRETVSQPELLPCRREEVVIERFDPATSRWLPEPEEPPAG